MTGAKRLVWPMIVVALIIAACGIAEEEPDEEPDDQTAVTAPASEEDLVSTPTVATEEGSDEESDGVLEIGTLLPFESGLFEGKHWIKWQLDDPITLPFELHTTFQLNIRSAEDDVFGVGWTVPTGEEPFASGFCLEDRPNCADGTVPVDVEVGPEQDELTFFIPVGIFNDATDLRIFAFIQTFPLDADPITEDVGDGTPILMSFAESDPC
jgi:hypothetical protein